MFTPSFQKPSVMNHDFSKVPHADIQRSSFRRSHGYKTTLNTDYLYPIFVDEALPGDTFNVKLSSVARINTLLYPLMDNLVMDFFFFAVPNRLLWTNWKRFMGERDPDPDSSIDYTVPVITDTFVAETLGDYFGLPTATANDITVNSLHFRAYNLIWNEWFRDENLQDSVTVDKDDGPDTMTDYVLLKRGKRHDYFTSCLPWPQRGDAVELPLGTSADIFTDAVTALGTDLTVWSTADSDWVDLATNSGNNNLYANASDVEANKLYADLSTATAASINSIREAFQLQRLLERDARGGTRYIEMIKSHFGVTSPDYRLQRPEYLGGGSKPVVIEPVPQTSFSQLGEMTGDLAGLGYCNQSGIGFTKSFTEHCVLIGLVNIRADLTYQTGINRMWSRQTRYDYYFPSLAHLGEQEVLNKEIYADGSANDDLVFGYQERWSEYRYKPSLITGQLRSNHATSLDAWHLSQDFGSLPVLNASFIEEDVPMSRVVAVSANSPDFTFDAYFDMLCTRPMPMYSVPGMIDHF